jgi:hypothetical protein
VQTAAARIIFVRKFASGMQCCQDDLKSGLLHLGVLVNGDASPVVLDAAGGSVLVQSDDDAIAFAGKKFVDGIVYDFPEQVMQSPGIHATDVHGRASPDRLKPFQYFNVLARVT